jgi:methanogenic corrinoid protein MtbC1
VSFNPSLSESSIADAYIQALLVGDRSAARSVVEDAMNCGVEALEVLTKLVWPVMERVQYLFREDRITGIALNMATRLNRQISDQIARQLPSLPANGKRAVIACGDAEPEELGGQIAVDLFEAMGWEVRFVGGGVANDELLQLIGDYRPHLLCLFATRPQGVPAVRKLIDYLRDVNSNPDMQVMCCGGIYKRAEGLAEEIGADLYAPDALDAVRIASENPFSKASAKQQTVGRGRYARRAVEARRSGETRAA